MKLLLASQNQHKIAEIRRILAGLPVELITLRDYPNFPEIPETGSTFEENALIKAQYAFKKTGHPTIADDSGIEIDALDGAPGVHSKRFSKEGTDETNNELLLEKLAEHSNRDARYRCVLALVTSNSEKTASGACEGTIGHQYIGEGGFGYDPLFWPKEFPGKTMAQLTMDEKNQISHRGKAFRLLPALLEECALL